MKEWSCFKVRFYLYLNLQECLWLCTSELSAQIHLACSLTLPPICPRQIKFYSEGKPSKWFDQVQIKRNDIIRTLDESYLTKITRFKKSSLGMKYFIIGLINAWSLVSYNLYSYGRMKFLRNLPFSAKYQLAMSSLASHKTCKFISKKWHFVSVW